MTRKKASIQSLSARKVVRKRTLRRYAQREIQHWLKIHPKQKKGDETSTSDLTEAD